MSILDSENSPLVQSKESAHALNNQNYSTMNMLFSKCRQSLGDRKLIVDFLAICFGIGAWIAINGMFVQLPLLVQTQPEGWNLPSFLTVIIQVANIGPILYSVSQGVCRGRIRDSWVIYGLLIMGTIALLLMAFFYQETTFIGSKEASTSLFSLVFFIALVGCTSSVLFMPFMGNFHEIYLVSYFVGEGLSGFLPSVVALGQGVGGNPSCVNQTNTDGTTSIVPYTPPPNFSTQVFFFFLFGTLALSTLAFFLLNNLKTCKTEKVSFLKEQSIRNMSNRADDNNTSGSNGNIPTLSKNADVDILNDDESSMGNAHSSIKLSDIPQTSQNYYKPDIPQTVIVKESNPVTNRSSIYLLALVAWVCFLGNGVFPSIQSYSCLPYGNMVYHLTATLGSMANPMACFLAFFLPISSILNITILTTLTTAVSAYIATTALTSPEPPLVGTTAGETLVVVAWIINTGLISYVKLSIATRFRREVGRALFWCGAVQQMGSAVGAIITFFLVNYTYLFTSYYPCN